MQPAAALRVVAPAPPGGEKVQSEAEAGFENDEAIPALPACRQIVAAEKDMARLRRTAVSGVVDVIVGGGIRGAIRFEVETGGQQGHGGDSTPAAQRAGCRDGGSHRWLKGS